VEVWETPRLRRRLRLDAEGAAELDSLRFSRDGTRLLAQDPDGRVYVWSLPARRPKVLSGHDGLLASAEFSQDGRYVVTAGFEDGAARIWNPDSGQLLAELPNSGAAALLPDNRRVVTIGDGPRLILDCDACGTWDQLVQRIDDRVRRELTPAERATYVR
jgi:WD40 repeat protein